MLELAGAAPSPLCFKDAAGAIREDEAFEAICYRYVLH